MNMQFQLFGIPVRVQPFFLLIAALIAATWSQGPGDWLTRFIIVVPIVFVGVLAHEYGHAFAGRAYGLSPRIDLHGFGGLTSWEGSGRALTPGRSILVSFAGPLVGIVAGGAAFVAMGALGPSEDSTLEFALTVFVFVNLGWGILNLFPMMPLDGGNIMASFFELFSPRRGRVSARWVSLVLNAALIAFAIYIQAIYLILILGFLAWTNFRALQAERQIGRDLPLVEELRATQRALEGGNVDDAIERAESLTERSETPLLRAEALHLLAWAKFLKRDYFGARSALGSLPRERPPEPALDGALLVEMGEAEAAIGPLEEALATRGGPLVEAYLARALVEAGRFKRAVRVFGGKHGAEISPETIRAVEEAARTSGHDEEADELSDLAKRRGMH